MQFDEMETFEHTKCKPISIALAVENKTRRILGIQVSEMPSKGPLAKISRAKYGPRKDDRNKGLDTLFKTVIPLCEKTLLMHSDKCPRYAPLIEKLRKKQPDLSVTHIQTKGSRGSGTGQDEIKKIKFDKLFSLNHTCAMYRANVNRLFRKTWNTTKKVENLLHHLYIYAHFHNTRLL